MAAPVVWPGRAGPVAPMGRFWATPARPVVPGSMAPAGPVATAGRALSAPTRPRALQRWAVPGLPAVQVAPAGRAGAPAAPRVSAGRAVTAGSVGRAARVRSASTTARSPVPRAVPVVPVVPVVPAGTLGWVAQVRPRVLRAPRVTAARAGSGGPAVMPGPVWWAPITVWVRPGGTAGPVGPVGRAATPMAVPVGWVPRAAPGPITAATPGWPAVPVVPAVRVVPVVTPGRVAPAWAAPRPRVPPVTGAPGGPGGPAVTPG